MSAAAEAATPNEDILLREDRGGIAWITLNRPNAFNSLSRPLIARLQEELDRMADDPSVRVIVLAGPATPSGKCAATRTTSPSSRNWSAPAPT